ncbi:MAG TPA: DUF2288 domain-containing protein [Paucimonas sp.]|nr:DUF2288 domain-containing protein [Paucimonas sp.]
MSNPSSSDPQYASLYAKLNLETARLPWTELLRHYAGGNVIVVSDGLDLIEVAARMANDDKDMVAQWLAGGGIAKVNDDQAKAWLEADLSLWAVVVKPWVLVQQRKEARKGSVH